MRHMRLLGRLLAVLAWAAGCNNPGGPSGPGSHRLTIEPASSCAATLPTQRFDFDMQASFDADGVGLVSVREDRSRNTPFIRLGLRPEGNVVLGEIWGTELSLSGVPLTLADASGNRAGRASLSASGDFGTLRLRGLIDGTLIITSAPGGHVPRDRPSLHARARTLTARGSSGPRTPPPRRRARRHRRRAGAGSRGTASWGPARARARAAAARPSATCRRAGSRPQRWH